MSTPVPFVRGGRDPATGMDCLGVTGFCAERFGLPWADPWDLIQEAWLAGTCSFEEATGLADGWVRVMDVYPAKDLDVVLFANDASRVVVGGIGFVLPGQMMISAKPGVGVYQTQYFRVAQEARQLWRCVG